jgi:hypothetical protein
MPTTRPRYTVTDIGHTAELLDLAHRAWPEVTIAVNCCCA